MEECSICLKPLKDDVLTTSCQHEFHDNCLREWKNKTISFTCPLCRSSLQLHDLFDVIETGSYEDVKLLVGLGADLSRRNSDGDTVLIYAARKGHLEIVMLLVEKGADVSHQNNKGYTALIRAANNGHSEIVKLLVEYGA